jgi:putative ABC transport system permease protein
MSDVRDLTLELRLAWRNIGRNARRSLLFLLAVAVGLFGLLASLGLMHGLSREMLEEMTGTHLGDVQVARLGFNDNPVLSLTLENPAPVERVLENTPGIAHWAPRVLLQGMAQSGRGSQGALIVGIDPAREKDVTVIAQRVTEGTYLSGTVRSGVLIGEEMARRLSLKIGQRLVVFAQGRSGELVSAAWPITGLFRTSSPDFDRSMVYVGIDDLRGVLGLGRGVSTLTLRTTAETTAARLDEVLTRALAGRDLEVLAWGEVVPAMLQSMEVWDFFIYIFFILVFIAMVFGIMNTMTMAVFERIQEFGVLSALGTLPGRIFRMVVYEAGLLGLLGLGVGWLGTILLMLLTARSGIDLSVFSQALASLGSGSTIYIILAPRDFLISGALALLFAVISAVLPALRAMRFEPVEALRHV